MCNKGKKMNNDYKKYNKIELAFWMFSTIICMFLLIYSYKQASTIIKSHELKIYLLNEKVDKLQYQHYECEEFVLNLKEKIDSYHSK
jgi:beta-lactamase regulating signal transducer with metallopeptidase domain